MKGKSKSQSDRNKESSSSSSSALDKDCPLTYPDVAPVEHERECPTFSKLLKRSLDDGVTLDDTEGLQGDLETLLASVAKRMRLLEAQINILSVWLEKGKIDKKSLSGPSTSTPSSSSSSKTSRESPADLSPSTKRTSKSTEERSSKKMKDNSGRAVSSKTDKPMKSKSQSSKMPEDTHVPESPQGKLSKSAAPKTKELPKLPKNDTPNRFWAMIEPYCQEITTEDLKVLEEIMKSHEDDADYYKVPSLGKHYSQKWAQEDLAEEQKEGSKLSDRSSTGGATDPSSLLKRCEENEDDSPFGPLTQRLVQALMEENIMTPIDDSTISEADAVEAATVSARSLAKQLNLGNTATLERRIRKELEENGILDADDLKQDEEESGDEVLAELKKKQQELRVLSQQNLTSTKRLFKMAKDEIQRQELRKKMAAADADVLDAYRRLQSFKQKKRTPTKKDKEMAVKVLKEREALVKAIENLG